MSTYQKDQEFKDLLWGTPAPIMVMINAQPVRLRARGICALVVTDPGALEAHVPDPGGMTQHVRNLLANAVADVIFPHSRSVTDVAGLDALKDEIAADLRSNVEPAFNGMGLKVKNLEIQAIEGM